MSGPGEHVLHDSEHVLEDGYPIVNGYVYIVDGVFTRANFEGTVADWKRVGKKEVRRCDLFKHPGARLGDRAVSR